MRQAPTSAAESSAIPDLDQNATGFTLHLAAGNRSPNTIKAYAHDLKDWFCYLSGRGLAWDEVTLEDIASFVAWLRLPPQGRDGTVAVLGPSLPYWCET